MRQDFYDLLEGMRYLLPASGPAFAAWLARSLVYARRVWREWSGGVSFTEIVCAGDVARVAAGIRPVGGRRYRMAVLDLLPPASPVLLERMPRLCLSGWQGLLHPSPLLAGNRCALVHRGGYCWGVVSSL